MFNEVHDDNVWPQNTFHTLLTKWLCVQWSSFGFKSNYLIIVREREYASANFSHSLILILYNNSLQDINLHLGIFESDVSLAKKSVLYVTKIIL